MSNAMIPNSTPLPAFLQKHLEANKPSADVASLATAQNSTPRLSLRAKVFRFMEGSEEVYKNKDEALVYIVGVEPAPGKFTKTFYINPYAGSDSAGQPPDCSSADGVRPDPWINQPQHSDCAGCPKNQFGSATSRKGRPSKACHDSKRLYVARADEKANDTPLEQRKLYLNQVPVSSLKALADYGRTLQSMGVEPWMVITRLTMVEDAEFPELQFAVHGFIAEADLINMKDRAAKREWAVSRNLMLQNQQLRTQLPPHLQNVLGGVATSAAAPAVQSQAENLAPSVNQHVAAQASALNNANPPAGGAAPSNQDLLSKW